jgi:hypothetical protein
MHVILAGQLLLEAVLLGLLVRWIAPHNATADLFNTVVVIGGTLLGGILIDWGFTAVIGSWTLVVHALLLVVLLIKITGTNPVQAATVTVLFFAAKVGLLLVWLRFA